MKNRHPLKLIALEFMDRFPKSKLFGVYSTQNQLQAVMEEAGWDQAELLYRIRQWNKSRNDLTPKQLVKPLPKLTIEAETKPPPPRQFGPVPDERFLYLLRPYDEEDI